MPPLPVPPRPAVLSAGYGHRGDCSPLSAYSDYSHSGPPSSSERRGAPNAALALGTAYDDEADDDRRLLESYRSDLASGRLPSGSQYRSDAYDNYVGAAALAASSAEATAASHLAALDAHKALEALASPTRALTAYADAVAHLDADSACQVSVWAVPSDCHWIATGIATGLPLDSPSGLPLDCHWIRHRIAIGFAIGFAIGLPLGAIAPSLACPDLPSARRHARFAPGRRRRQLGTRGAPRRGARRSPAATRRPNRSRRVWRRVGARPARRLAHRLNLGLFVGGRRALAGELASLSTPFPAASATDDP